MVRSISASGRIGVVPRCGIVSNTIPLIAFMSLPLPFWYAVVWLDVSLRAVVLIAFAVCLDLRVQCVRVVGVRCLCGFALFVCGVVRGVLDGSWGVRVGVCVRVSTCVSPDPSTVHYTALVVVDQKAELQRVVVALVPFASAVVLPVDTSSSEFARLAVDVRPPRGGPQGRSLYGPV